MRFQDQTVVITGAGRGIGRAIAEAFVAEGARVYAADIDLAGVEPVAGVSMVHLDVSDAAQVEAFFAQVGDRLHVLINNAGISQFGDVMTAPLELFDRVIGVNLRGAYLMARFAAPLLKAAGQASIINMASTRAIMSEPGNEAYAASKGGLLGLTHALANSLGPAVRVNAILPGWIDTHGGHDLREIDHAQHPVGRVGRPEDIAQACLFLADPAQSGFMTGQNLVIDGGMTRKMIYVE